MTGCADSIVIAIDQVKCPIEMPLSATAPFTVCTLVPKRSNCASTTESRSQLSMLPARSLDRAATPSVSGRPYMAPFFPSSAQTGLVAPQFGC
jgi:hypothetical protein